jgi:hypothetical protein
MKCSELSNTMCTSQEILYVKFISSYDKVIPALGFLHSFNHLAEFS